MQESKRCFIKDFVSKKKKLFLLVCIIVIISVLGIGLALNRINNSQAEISVKATLERIVKTSDLSTYEAVYNGIAEVRNEKKTEKIDFYVSYEAKVKVGVDVEQIELAVNEKEKVVYITLPQMKITDTEVKIESFDYIFVKDKANNENVSAKAYKACIADVEKEASEENAIFELAEENAKSIIKALVNPFFVQDYTGYEIVFN